MGKALAVELFPETLFLAAFFLFFFFFFSSSSYSSLWLMRDVADSETTYRKLQEEGKVREGEGGRWMVSKSLERSAL